MANNTQDKYFIFQFYKACRVKFDSDIIILCIICYEPLHYVIMLFYFPHVMHWVQSYKNTQMNYSIIMTYADA